jgi:hypothetical protein
MAASSMWDGRLTSEIRASRGRADHSTDHTTSEVTMRRRILSLALLVPAVLAACDDSAPVAPRGDAGADPRLSAWLAGERVTPRNLLGVDADNELVTFATHDPATIVRRVRITGLAAGESIIGIDVRPADNLIYGVGSTSRIYVIDRASGAATPVGSAAFAPALAGRAFGVDFNPVADRLRVHGSEGQNLRLNQLTGDAIADTALAYATLDANAGRAPSVAGTAYTNSVAGATATQLYAIDTEQGALALLPSPNGGQMQTVGALRVPTGRNVGFDIDGRDGVALAALTAPGARNSTLHVVDLATGEAMRVGAVGGRPLRGITVAP